MPNTKSDEAPERASNAVHGIPVARAGSLLSSLPPHGGDGDEARPDGSLERAQAETRHHHAREAVSRRHEAQCRAPKQHHDAGELCDGQADKQPGQGELHDELCEVDDGAEPAVLVALKANVLDKAEDGAVREGGLVGDLEEVDDEHDGQKDRVDAPQDALLILWGDDDAAEIAALLAQQLARGAAAGCRGRRGSRIAMMDVVVSRGYRLVPGEWTSLAREEASHRDGY